jgi:hypothetical protein
MPLSSFFATFFAEKKVGQVAAMRLRRGGAHKKVKVEYFRRVVR